MRVAILGGGISGFSCAVQILEYLKQATVTTPVEVTVISELFTPHTTGDGSAGLWSPYLVADTPTNKLHKWSKSMHGFLEKLWLSEDASEAGVCLIPVVRLTSNTAPIDDFWKDIVYGCEPMNEKLLQSYNVGRTKKYVSGLHFVTYTSEPVKLLPYLMKRFQQNGGKIVQQKVEDLQKFAANTDYDVIINCTGLGSKELLKDQEMFPVRGQVTRVKANWLYCVLLDESDDGNYIIPNTESVVLGGTHQHDFDTTVCAEDKDFIMNGCRSMVPGLVYATLLKDWVGLRPGRSALRLEVGSDLGPKKVIIHNYGHGGSGVTLAWGCAEDVLNLLKSELVRRNFVNRRSKL